MTRRGRGRPLKLSPEQVAEIVRRWDEGSATVVELADDLGVHRNVVRRYLFHKGLATRPHAARQRRWTLPPETRQRISEGASRVWAERRARA